MGISALEKFGFKGKRASEDRRMEILFAEGWEREQDQDGAGRVVYHPKMLGEELEDTMEWDREGKRRWRSQGRGWEVRDTHPTSPGFWDSIPEKNLRGF